MTTPKKPLNSHQDYASSKIYNAYYKLCGEICNTYDSVNKKKKREKLQYINAKKVENFEASMRKELEIKD